MTDAIDCELTLFVNGASDRSARAITNARALCDVDLAGRGALSIVDVREDGLAAQLSQILATPTLVRMRPSPIRKVVGDLSDAAKVLSALGLRGAGDGPDAAGGKAHARLAG
jgi:circadian clock protein KaiB